MCFPFSWNAFYTTIHKLEQKLGYGAGHGVASLTGYPNYSTFMKSMSMMVMT